MKRAWVRIASSVQGFVNGTVTESRTLEAMRTQAFPWGSRC
jgi:hypothetical protein